MDMNRIIEKIKKCLALGQSSNAHEAAAALRQAQKLMSAHDLTKDDVEGSNYGNETVECPIQAGKTVPAHLIKFVGVIEKAFHVRPVIERNVRVSDESFRIRYFGPTARVAMAAYAHVVIFRAMTKAWDTAMKENPMWKGVRGARLSFMLGWLDEIQSKVEAIGWPEDELKRTDMLREQFYGRNLVTAKQNKPSLYGTVVGSGRKAAADFNINRPVDGSQQARIGRD